MLTMFHKVTIIIYGIISCLCAVNYYSVFILNHFYLDNKRLFSILVLFILFVFASFLFLFITSLITNVKVGKPPLNSLIIAYKYGLSDTVTSTNIFHDMKIFPERDTVQICYESRHGPFGIAHGAVIQEDFAQEISDKAKDSLDLNGYNLFQTKEIPNALYISCPTLPWLSYFGVWLVLRIVYPKLYKYSKKNRLSAYPVVELYKRFSIVLMAPLSRQDYFVVPEAAPYLQRSFSCSNTSMSTITNISRSTQQSKSQTASMFSCTDVDDSFSQLTTIHSSTPKLANGNAQKYI